MPTTEDAHKRVMHDLDGWVDALRTANEELRGEKEPADPAGLVNRIREANSKIQFLLDEAERLGVEDVRVKRLRAVHPARPAT